MSQIWVERLGEEQTDSDVEWEQDESALILGALDQ